MSRSREDILRHNYLMRRSSTWGRSVIPIGVKIRAGLGYPPTSKLMPNLGRPWSELGK